MATMSVSTQGDTPCCDCRMPLAVLGCRDVRFGSVSGFYYESFWVLLCRR